MKHDRRTSVLWGLLLIAGILFGILNSVPAIENPDYLIKLPTIETRVLLAVFFQATMAIVYTITASLLYPKIRSYNERLAAGYLGFRIIGAGFLYAGIGSLLLLLWLSQSYVTADQIDISFMQTIGELIRRGRDILNHIGMILPWSIGGLILYYCLYRIQLIPQWLSIWGFIGSAFTLLATILIMLNIIKIVTPVYIIMNVPTAIFELYLALYLLIKGFNTKKDFLIEPSMGIS